MRVVVAGLSHETNRFSPIPTSLEDFQPARVGYDDLLCEAGTAGAEVLPLGARRAAPSAPAPRDVYLTLRDDLLAGIASIPRPDVVLLSLHGAQVAEGYDDCEGDIVAAVRKQVGPSCVIGVLLDLHASLSERLLQEADLVTAIKEYPHTDFPETARQLVNLCLRFARDEIRPVTALLPLPLFTLWHTPQEPARSIVERARALEAAEQVLHVSLVHGFPWSDVADAGAAVLVTCDADAETALRFACEFGEHLWSIRAADLGIYLDRDDCLDKALGECSHEPEGEEPERHAENGPVVIADAADNPGAGAGGDATWILRALLERGVRGCALALCDARVLDLVLAAGEGAEIDVSLGGRSGPLAGEPIACRARVSSINHDALADAMPGYPPVPVGALAALDVAGNAVVVSALREQVFGPRVFSEVGVDVAARRLVVVKSAQHFYTAFAPLASRILYCDSPGARSISFAELPFTRPRGATWPINDQAKWSSSDARLFRSAYRHGR
ncbi:MAG: M81 family metallopeptidase [Pseudomonadota bacterium]